MGETSEKIPVKKAILMILFSLIVMTILFFGVLFYFRYIRAIKAKDPRYSIQIIATKCRSQEPLKTVYLAEILGLSSDKPVNMYEIREASLTERLRSCPAIKEGKVSFLEPGVAVVDYGMREPVALLGDYVNVALDEEKTAFPLEPYFGQKKLPEILIGSSEFVSWPGWGKPLHSTNLDLAYEILTYAKKRCMSYGLRIAIVDVSKAFSASADREVILQVAAGKKYTLRLSASSWQNDLERFFSLYPLTIETALYKAKERNLQDSTEVVGLENVVVKEAVIDLRLPKLAFIVCSSGKCGE